MAHSANTIQSIKLPNGITYEIHDAQAIHTLSDLEAVGLSGAFIYKGSVATKNDLPSTGNKIGYVYHVVSEDLEYVWAKIGTAAEGWEEFGAHISVDHTHNVTVTGTNQASAVSGSATVTGGNSTSTVTGTVTVPTASAGTKKYIKASATQGTVTPTKDSVLGANTTFTVSGGEASTTKIAATASGVAVGANGTAAAITALGTPTTATAITGLNTATVKNPTVTNVSIPNVTGNTSVSASKVKSAGSRTNGTAAAWSASVADGVLSFSWTANTPTAVTLPTFDTVTATNTTLGTALSASSVTTEDVTVATGSKSTANAITGFGTHTTANALTGVKVTAQPTVTLKAGTTGDVTVATGVSAIGVTASGDNVDALIGVTVAAPSVSLTSGTSSSTGAIGYIDDITEGTQTVNLDNGLAAAQVWTQNTGSISGTAAAQVWSQGTGSTGKPIAD